MLHIASSYAKILRETNFHTREIPQSGSKAKDGEREKNREERKLVITMASYALRTPPRVAHAKPRGPKIAMSGSVRQPCVVFTYTAKTGFDSLRHAYFVYRDQEFTGGIRSLQERISKG